MDACAKLVISPCTNAREMETGRLACALPDVSWIVTVSLVGGGGVPDIVVKVASADTPMVPPAFCDCAWK